MGEVARSPLSPQERAQETEIVTQTMGMPKVWCTTEYCCDLYLPLEGLGKFGVYLGGAMAS